jgi:hypothetical protein
MVAFSSAFHLDVESGVGAFASSSISHAAEYRPRSLTLYAVKALARRAGGPADPGATELFGADSACRGGGAGRPLCRR